MKKMFLIFSHKLTPKQTEDAQKNLNIDEFIPLPKELQQIWSNIPPEIKNLKKQLKPIKKFLKKNVTKKDYVLIQGDFGAVYEIVNLTKKLNAVAIYATTKREFSEKVIDGKVVKTSIFSHILFREYWDDNINFGNGR